MIAITRSLHNTVKLGLAAVFALGFMAQVHAQSAKPDGTWGWTSPGRNGGPDRKMTLKLKTEGDKVTGTLISPGQGGDPVETKIEDGKMKTDELTFTVTREFNGNKIVQKFNGKVTEDTIKGKIEFERNGQPQSRDWEAKKKTEEKK